MNTSNSYIRKIIILACAVLILSNFAVLANMVAADRLNLTAKPGCNEVTLSWNSLQGIQYYWPYQIFEDGSEYPLIDFAAKDLTFTHNDLEGGKEYCYIVKATDDKGKELSRSAKVCAKPDCSKEDDNCIYRLEFVVGLKTYTISRGYPKPPPPPKIVKREMDSPPVIVNNRTYMPAKYVIDNLKDSTIQWDPKTKEVRINAKVVRLGPPRKIVASIIVYKIGKNTVNVDGKDQPIDKTNSKIAPMIIGGRTMIPFRNLGENLGAKVDYIPSDKRIILDFDCRVNNTNLDPEDWDGSSDIQPIYKTVCGCFNSFVVGDPNAKIIGQLTFTEGCNSTSGQTYVLYMDRGLLAQNSADYNPSASLPSASYWNGWPSNCILPSGSKWTIDQYMEAWCNGSNNHPTNNNQDRVWCGRIKIYMPTNTVVEWWMTPDNDNDGECCNETVECVCITAFSFNRIPGQNANLRHVKVKKLSDCGVTGSPTMQLMIDQNMVAQNILAVQANYSGFPPNHNGNPWTMIEYMDYYSGGTSQLGGYKSWCTKIWYDPITSLISRWEMYPQYWNSPEPSDPPPNPQKPCVCEFEPPPPVCDVWECGGCVVSTSASGPPYQITFDPDCDSSTNNNIVKEATQDAWMEARRLCPAGQPTTLEITTDADFINYTATDITGSSNGINHGPENVWTDTTSSGSGTPHDRLTLNPAGGINLPFIWVPTIDKGTVSLVVTDNINGYTKGQVAGTYKMGFEDTASGESFQICPLSISVDLNGNCWVGNLMQGTVVKVFNRFTNPGWTNTNTSMGSTALAWGSDWCVQFGYRFSNVGLYRTGSGNNPSPSQMLPDARFQIFGSAPNQSSFFTDLSKRDPTTTTFINVMESTSKSAFEMSPNPTTISVAPDNTVWVGLYWARKLYHLDYDGNLMGIVDLNASPIIQNSTDKVQFPSQISCLQTGLGQYNVYCSTYPAMMQDIATIPNNNNVDIASYSLLVLHYGTGFSYANPTFDNYGYNTTNSDSFNGKFIQNFALIDPTNLVMTYGIFESNKLINASIGSTDLTANGYLIDRCVSSQNNPHDMPENCYPRQVLVNNGFTWFTGYKFQSSPPSTLARTKLESSSNSADVWGFEDYDGASDTRSGSFASLMAFDQNNNLWVLPSSFNVSTALDILESYSLNSPTGENCDPVGTRTTYPLAGFHPARGDITGNALATGSTSGEWISKLLDCCGPISWIATTPAGTSIKVFAQCAGSSTWEEMTNGSPPTCGCNGQIRLKVVFEAGPSVTTMPSLESISIRCQASPSECCLCYCQQNGIIQDVDLASNGRCRPCCSNECRWTGCKIIQAIQPHGTNPTVITVKDCQTGQIDAYYGDPNLYANNASDITWGHSSFVKYEIGNCARYCIVPRNTNPQTYAVVEWVAIPPTDPCCCRQSCCDQMKLEIPQTDPINVLSYGEVAAQNCVNPGTKVKFSRMVIRNNCNYPICIKFTPAQGVTDLFIAKDYSDYINNIPITQPITIPANSPLQYLYGHFTVPECNGTQGLTMFTVDQVNCSNGQVIPGCGVKVAVDCCPSQQGTRFFCDCLKVIRKQTTQPTGVYAQDAAGTQYFVYIDSTNPLFGQIAANSFISVAGVTDNPNGGFPGIKGLSIKIAQGFECEHKNISYTITKGSLNATLNGTGINLNRPPVLVGSELMIGIRDFAEMTGASAEWIAATETLIFTFCDTFKITFKMNSTNAVLSIPLTGNVENISFTLSQPLQVINITGASASTYLSLKSVVEYLGGAYICQNNAAGNMTCTIRLQLCPCTERQTCCRWTLGLWSDPGAPIPFPLEMCPGETVTRSLALRNECPQGSQPINIISVEPYQNCTTDLPAVPFILNPGQLLPFSLNFTMPRNCNPGQTYRVAVVVQTQDCGEKIFYADIKCKTCHGGCCDWVLKPMEGIKTSKLFLCPGETSTITIYEVVNNCPAGSAPITFNINRLPISSNIQSISPMSFMLNPGERKQLSITVKMPECKPDSTVGIDFPFSISTNPEECSKSVMITIFCKDCKPCCDWTFEGRGGSGIMPMEMCNGDSSTTTVTIRNSCPKEMQFQIEPGANTTVSLRSAIVPANSIKSFTFTFKMPECKPEQTFTASYTIIPPSPCEKKTVSFSISCKNCQTACCNWLFRIRPSFKVTTLALCPGEEATIGYNEIFNACEKGQNNLNFTITWPADGKITSISPSVITNLAPQTGMPLTIKIKMPKCEPGKTVTFPFVVDCKECGKKEVNITVTCKDCWCSKDKAVIKITKIDLNTGIIEGTQKTGAATLNVKMQFDKADRKWSLVQVGKCYEICYETRTSRSGEYFFALDYREVVCPTFVGPGKSCMAGLCSSMR